MSKAGSSLEMPSNRQEMEEKATVIHRVASEKLAARVHKLTDSIAQRAYEIFEGNGRSAGHDLEDWLEAETELLHPTCVELTETEDTVEVTAETPGFNDKELEIIVEPLRLTISGKRESHREENKKGKTVYSESWSNEILRTMPLPAAVDPQMSTAVLRNGMLYLVMPKAIEKDIQTKPKAA